MLLYAFWIEYANFNIFLRIKNRIIVFDSSRTVFKSFFFILWFATSLICYYNFFCICTKDNICIMCNNNNLSFFFLATYSSSLANSDGSAIPDLFSGITIFIYIVVQKQNNINILLTNKENKVIIIFINKTASRTFSWVNLNIEKILLLLFLC